MIISSRIPRVVETRHIRDYVLWLRFDDGLEGEVDLADGLHGEVFEPLKDVSQFADVFVEYGSITWRTGADWAPETLYERLLATKTPRERPIDDATPPAPVHESDVPEISRFYGVVIRMLAHDHAPPHFHAQYGEYEVTVGIRDGVVTGRFPGRALGLILEWRALHEAELMANWDRLREGQSPAPIQPLS